jgi:hypothetical protein
MVNEAQAQDELDDLTDEAREALQSDPKAFDPRELDSDDDRFEDYGIRVRTRIKKEVDRRKVIETELQSERSEKERLRAEREQFEAELREARERLSQFEEREGQTYKSREEDLLARRQAALDDGDLTAVNKLNDELLDVRLKLHEKTNRPAQKREPERQPPQQDVRPRVAATTQAWMDKRADRLDDNLLMRAARIEKELTQDGYKVSDPKLYEELDRRLFPEEYDDAGGLGDEYEALDDEPSATRQPQQRGAVAGVPRDSGSRRAAGRNQQLTADDLRKMARWNLDPNNPKDRAAWRNRNNPLS